MESFGRFLFQMCVIFLFIKIKIVLLCIGIIFYLLEVKKLVNFLVRTMGMLHMVRISSQFIITNYNGFQNGGLTIQK